MILEKPIEIVNLNIPPAYPVKYFIYITQDAYILSAFLAFIVLITEFFLNKVLIKNYADENIIFYGSTIRKIYKGEIKSFLLPKKSGYLRLWVVAIPALIILFFLTYSIIPIIYNKFYNSTFYNVFINFKEQDISSLFYWNLITLVCYQVMTSLIFLFFA